MRARRERRRGVWAAVVLASILGCADAESRLGAPAPTPPDPDAAATAELLGLLAGVAPRPPETTRPDSPLWPKVAYLRAEAALAGGDPDRARTGFRRLANWGASRPHHDDLGGSSLAAVSLWRWVDLLHARGRPIDNEFRLPADIEEPVRESQLARGIYRYGFLDALPQLEAETLAKLAVLCWRGGAVAEARRLFPMALELSTASTLGPEEQAMLDALVAEGELAKPYVVELRARRLEELRRHDEALEQWHELVRSGDPQQRDRGRLAVARIRARLFSGDRAELDELLTAVVEGGHYQDEALYARASVWAREGDAQSLQRFTDDLTRLLENRIESDRDDDALYRLASHHRNRYQSTGSPAEWERSLELFRQLRGRTERNDWLDSAYFQPAMMLYARGSSADLDASFELLRELMQKYPDGPLRRTAQFWGTRILHERGAKELAKQGFELLVEQRPYDYYAMRARMHLEHGPGAAGQLWPGPRLRKALAADFARHEPYATLSGDTVYHRRLRAAIDSGLYRRLLERRRALRARTPGTRIQELSLGSLAGSGDLVPLVLLLALRQDALAAAARPATPRNVLEVHAAVALGAGDLPLAISMALGTARDATPTDRPDQDPRFLQSAYPPAFLDVFREAAQSEQLPPELLYALSRRESLFDPAAISTFSARGLFQFIPSTFDALDERWKLLASSDATDRDSYLFDPGLNARLGARWLADELIHRQNCVLLKQSGFACNAANRADPKEALVTTTDWFDETADTRLQRVVLLSLMEHSRGYTAVRGWLEQWAAGGHDRDIEYMIETAPAAETRILVRGVVTDASIAASIGLFRERPPTSRP